MSNGFRTLRNAAVSAGLGAALSLAAVSPSAAQSADARWLPWMGCWTPAEAAEQGMLCVRPAEQPASVEALRVVDGAVESREVLFADGVRHATDRGGCQGWEEGAFSQDQRRVLMTFEHVCEGGQEQEGGGIMALVSPDEWLDVRVIGVQGERSAWVQRYRRVDAETAAAAGFGDIIDEEQAWNARSARMVASAPLDLDDVIEASATVPSEAVIALLTERGDRFDLEAADVLRLADAGVPDDVIDATVAVSYPDRFAFTAGYGPEPIDPEVDGRRYGYRPIMGPFGYSAFYGPWSLRYGYGAYGWGYGYGYPYYGRFGGYGYRPAVVIVDRAVEHGRVINGRGYTRSRGSSAVGGSGYIFRGRPSAGSSSGGSGSARPSSGATGRRAKPRGGSDQVRPSAGSSSGGSGSARPSSSGSSAKPQAKPRGGR